MKLYARVVVDGATKDVDSLEEREVLLVAADACKLLLWDETVAVTPPGNPRTALVLFAMLYEDSTGRPFTYVSNEARREKGSK